MVTSCLADRGRSGALHWVKQFSPPPLDEVQEGRAAAIALKPPAPVGASPTGS